MNNVFKIEYFISSGPGGQRRNKKKTGVRITHLPSGFVVHVEDQRSQTQNKKVAFEILAKKLKKIYQREKKRITTRVPKNIKEERLKRKKYQSQKKRLRRELF